MRKWSSPWVVTGVYSALALLMTWPLATHLSTKIAGDLGDPLYSCWAMMWEDGRVMAALSGHVSALADFWNTNIFYPSPLTLTFSEHLTPQALQVLPIFAATHNILLAYNLLVLSTMVLSGLAVYLLVRDLTSEPVAAFVAGLAFAFAPYRFVQIGHIHVLSSYWMPLAFVGFRRFFVTGRARPLIGGAVALALQDLSCGQYMLYFTPFMVAYCLYEMAHRGLLRSLRVWRSLAIAGVAVTCVTLPFVVPYLMVRQGADVGVRTLAEIKSFSADTYAYGTATASFRWLGAYLTAHVSPEGEGFQGFTIMALGFAGVAVGCASAARAAANVHAPVMRPWQQFLGGLLGVAFVMGCGMVLALFAIGIYAIPTAAGRLVVRHGDRALWQLAALMATILALVPAARRFVRGVPASAFGFFAWALVVAVLLSFGPEMRANGAVIGDGPYFWLYHHVPGFDGVRVPARYAMLVAFFLSVLAGVGAAGLIAKWRRVGTAVVAVACVLILAESWVVPFGMNMPVPAPGYALPPGELLIGDRLSPLYRQLEALPGRVILVEFPYGSPMYDLRATFYSGYHQRPLLNGYSGFFPGPFLQRVPLLTNPASAPELAWKTLTADGTTHAIVHEAAFLDGRGIQISAWLRQFGAKEIVTDGSDRLFQLR
jgi:hypothetical protein